MNTQELRKLLDEDRLIIGLNETRRALRDGSVSEVVIAENAPAGEKDAMVDYAEMAGVSASVLESRNDVLGTMLRKPFPVSFLAVKDK